MANRTFIKSDAGESSFGSAARRSVGQALAGILVLGLALFWLTIFSISLWAMPELVDSSNVPETSVTARYLSEGKSRLGLLTKEGQLDRHTCDPFSQLCRFVKAHSPVDLMVRVWRPTSALSGDSVVLFARVGENVLVSTTEGAENYAALKKLYAGGVVSTMVGVLIGAMLLRSRRPV